MSDLALAMALAIGIFLSLKAIYSIQAAIFVSLMGKKLPLEFYKTSRSEIILGAIVALSFSFRFIFREGTKFLAIIFIASGLLYLTYMTLRAYRLLGKQRP